MELRSIPQDFDKTALAEIDRRLAAIRTNFDVHIPLAIESGSRAWGFPSPDSDFDCRFVYVRSAAAHLTPWPVRDVIETPLIDDIDLNGWDLGKALGLMLKGNAVILEWLESPICYSGAEWFREELRSFAKKAAERNLVARHYLHLGQNQWRRISTESSQIPLKRTFYFLRPAAALRWLRLHPGKAVAPMHFPTLMVECDPPPALAAIVKELITKKAQTRELGEAPLPKKIAEFVEAEFAMAEAAFAAPTPNASALAAIRQEAAGFYRHVVERLDAEHMKRR